MNKQRKKNGRFLKGALIYGAVLLLLGGVGLIFLWNFLASYEHSRPQTTLAAYQQQLTPDYICDRAVWLRDTLDSGIQSEEEFREVVRASAEKGVSFARKSRECTDNRMVYALRSGTDVIGQITMEAGEPDFYGMSAWTVTEETYDYSQLCSEVPPITVPQTYQVSVNGHVLDETYLTGETVQYPALMDFADQFDLPCQVVYDPGSLLGPAEVQVLDDSGNPFAVDEVTDWSFIYDNCTDEEKEELDEFTEAFVKRYVAFTGSNRNNKSYNHTMLSRYILGGSDLARRLWVALDGLTYGSSLRNELVSITTHFQTRLAEDAYLCDITYEVDTTGRKGLVRTATNAQALIRDTSGGFKVEYMNIY